MRLQLSVLRHALPPCNILFTTGSGPASQTASRTATISDLLADVNHLVPLESSDGAWCLEDYVVEIAATAAQEFRYECLHYSEIRKVLREDDEVVIRGLKNEELRERRVGGRFQISEDGRHLVDGVGWGRRWVRAEMGRPGVRIPERKRRRLLVNGEEENGGKSVLAVTSGEGGTRDQLLLQQDTDDDEDDDSLYMEEEADEDSGQLQITASANFEDADDEEAPSEDGDDEGNDFMLEEQLVPSQELQDLLDEAERDIRNGKANTEELDEADAPMTPRSGKRKRDIGDDGEEPQEASEFEGFPTPVASHGLATNLIDDVSESDSESESSDSSTSDSEDGSIPTGGKNDSHSSSAEGTSSSDSEDEDALESGPGRNRNVLSELTNGIPRRPASSSPSTHNDSSSDSVNGARLNTTENQPTIEELDISQQADTESDSSSSYKSSSDDSDVEIGPDEDLPTSESGSISESSGSDSSSEDEGPEVEVKVDPTAPEQQKITSRKPDSAPLSSPVQQSAPFKGLLVTRMRNDRNKRKSRLKALKAEGILPTDANFAALYDYDQRQAKKIIEATPEIAESIQPDQKLEQDVEDKKQRLLQQLASESKEEHEMLLDHPASDNEPAPSIRVVRHDSESNKMNDGTNTPPTVDTPTKEGFTDVMETRSEPTKKRSRLDLVSSRRMLFGSLGLKTPKSPAAEQALREKLSQDIRKHPVSVGEHEEATGYLEQEEKLQNAEEDNDWKRKILLSAVECEHEGVQLKQPSFPFVQRWDTEANRHMSKRHYGNDQQYHQSCRNGSDGIKGGAEDQESVPTVPMLGQVQVRDKTPTVQSKPLSAKIAKIEDLARPNNFEGLPTLELQDALPGAVIAFREWHINESGEPGVSDYRVARIARIDNGLVSLVLSKRDRDAAIRAKYDEVTGERIYSRFEAPVDDAEEERGIGERTMPFQDLQEPKSIEQSTVQVPASNEPATRQESVPEMSLMEDESGIEHIPETGAITCRTTLTKVEVSTPRREEITNIIKEAGFDSALDEQLLEMIPATVTAGSDQEASSYLGLLQQNLQTSSQQPPTEDFDDNMNETLDTGGFESPHFNGWSSDPPQEPEDESRDHGGLGDDWHSSQISLETTPKPKPPPPTSQNVSYPSISQLDIGESPIANDVDSSSYQDAQRARQLADVNVPIRPSVANGIQGDEDQSSAQNGDEDEIADNVLDSLRSVIAPPEDNADESYVPSPERDSAATNDASFLGPGLDGHVSSGSDVDYNDDLKDESDESDLPSLRTLTSSQVQLTRAKSREARLSPPPLNRTEKLRNGKIWKGKEKEKSPALGYDAVSSHSQSSPKIKISASQRETRQSRSPEGGQVVDLTISSDPLSPGGNDGEYVNKGKRRGKESRQASGGGKIKAAEKAGRNGKDSMPITKDGLGLSVASGLGNKTFLKGKKSKSRI